MKLGSSNSGTTVWITWYSSLKVNSSGRNSRAMVVVSIFSFTLPRASCRISRWSKASSISKASRTGMSRTSSASEAA
ncbi:hypothetical protein D3C81_1805350 [compost metagenome]